MIKHKDIKTGRRERRHNGDARDNTPWTIKAVPEATRANIRSLAALYDATQASIIVAAVNALVEKLAVQTPSKAGKGNTFSNINSELLLDLVTDRSPTTDPEVLEIERRIEARRAEQKKFIDSVRFLAQEMSSPSGDQSDV